MLPSNTSDLIHLLVIRCVSLATVVGFKRGCNLLHKVPVLKNMQSLLLSFPILSAHNYEGLSGTTCHLERFVPVNDLFHNTFQIVSEFVDADDVHVCTNMYGVSVQL